MDGLNFSGSLDTYLESSYYDYKHKIFIGKSITVSPILSLMKASESRDAGKKLL